MEPYNPDPTINNLSYPAQRDQQKIYAKGVQDVVNKINTYPLHWIEKFNQTLRGQLDWYNISIGNKKANHQG